MSHSWLEWQSEFVDSPCDVTFAYISLCNTNAINTDGSIRWRPDRRVATRNFQKALRSSVGNYSEKCTWDRK
jgi:hypothetical protein